ncbi:hypothetical protein D039_3207A, partial [Vibrio parahaemolyticus EKP-028]
MFTGVISLAKSLIEPLSLYFLIVITIRVRCKNIT